MDVVVWENYSLEELWCERVAVLGSCGVCDLQCMAVAAYKSYYLWEYWCVSCGVGCGVEVWGDCGMWQSLCERVALWGSCIVWGSRWLPNLNAFWRFLAFPPCLCLHKKLIISEIYCG